MELTYQIIFRPEPEGGYTVIVPSLPGCITYGKTLDKAKEMAKEAIELHIQAMKEHNEDIIDDSDTLDTRLQIAIS